MINIKCLFWNINKKNLVQEIIESCIENKIDIIMLAEAENLDSLYLVSQLAKTYRIFEKKELVPQNKGIVLFANEALGVNVYKEETYFTAYKVRDKEQNFLLIVLHLTSAMFKNEFARAQKANLLSRTIDKLEESCNVEAKRKGEKKYSTVVVGDFNLHPFSDGIIGVYGFNAVMDKYRAKKLSRSVDGQQMKFYYNPMWQLMGKHDGVLGTYYSDSDQEDKSFYWYTFDQILIRPELISGFIWDEFEIIKSIGKKNLIQNNRICKEKYSDHLPIKFEIR